jgi:hypothetical protein
MASQPTSAAVAAAGGGLPKTREEVKAESNARRAAAVAAKATAKAALTRACESTYVPLTREEFEKNEAKAEAELQALWKKGKKRPIKFDPNRLKFAMETKMKSPPPAVKAVKDKASVERLLEVTDAPSTAFETITIAKALEMEMQAEEAKAKAKKKKDAEDAAALAALLEKADFQEDEEDDEEDEDEEDEDDEEAEDDDGYWDNLNKTKEEFEKNKVTKEREEVFKHHTEIMADIRELQALAEKTNKESAV